MTENFAESFIICEDDEFLITDLQTDYQQITESLLYAVIQTHSDLATAFLKLVQFNVKGSKLLSFISKHRSELYNMSEICLTTASSTVMAVRLS